MAGPIIIIIAITVDVTKRCSTTGSVSGVGLLDRAAAANGAVKTEETTSTRTILLTRKFQCIRSSVQRNQINVE